MRGFSGGDQIKKKCRIDNHKKRVFETESLIQYSILNIAYVPWTAIVSSS